MYNKQPRAVLKTTGIMKGKKRKSRGYNFL